MLHCARGLPFSFDIFTMGVLSAAAECVCVSPSDSIGVSFSSSLKMGSRSCSAPASVRALPHAVLLWVCSKSLLWLNQVSFLRLRIRQINLIQREKCFLTLHLNADDMDYHTAYAPTLHKWMNRAEKLYHMPPPSVQKKTLLVCFYLTSSYTKPPHGGVWHHAKCKAAVLHNESVGQMVTNFRHMTVQ